MRRRLCSFTITHPVIRSLARDDLALTGRLVRAGELMAVDVIDHVILADARYCSFKETGRL